MDLLQWRAFSPMIPTVADCPAWLATLLHQAGGTVPFRQFMDWALHHPEHGYYGSGRVRIGPQGDFATSPSLGPDFATLLGRQLIAAQQSVTSMPRQALHQGADFSEIPALHHMQAQIKR